MAETDFAQTDNPLDAATCLAALREQRDCYAKLDALSGEQKQFVDGGDSDGLLDVLQRRQTWADRAVEIDRQLQPLKRGWPESARRWTAEQRVEARSLFGEIKAFLESLTRRDVGDMLSLQRQKHAVGREVSRLAAGEETVRRVNGRYAAAAYGAAAAGRMDVTK